MIRGQKEAVWKVDFLKELAPLMFFVYVTYMTEGVNSYISLFADDSKSLRIIES